MPPFTLSRQKVRELDRRAMTEFGMPGVALMENAGRSLADLLGSLGVQGKVVIACGSGNNGGDGFVLARHLELRSIDVQVLCWSECAQGAGDAAVNYRILERSGTPLVRLPDAAAASDYLSGAAWIVDALLGTGARGEPRAPMDGVINALNAAGVPILAVDLPSGLDCDSGQPARHTIRAQHTGTFVAYKPGFLAAGAEAFTGAVHVLDIGAPRKLLEELLRSG